MRRGADSKRSAGLGTPRRRRSRRHSSACHAMSSGRAERKGGFIVPFPGREHARAVDCVLVEEVGQVPHRREPAGPTVRWAGEEARRCAASGRMSGSSRCSSTSWSRGQTERSGDHGSAPATGPAGTPPAGRPHSRGN